MVIFYIFSVLNLLLKKKPLKGPIVSFFDEASMLLGAFGRYSVVGALYERSIYLELANTGRVFKNDLKTERARIANLRLNICVSGHPFSFVWQEILEKRFSNNTEKMALETGIP